jgi:hypothetical protein
MTLKLKLKDLVFSPPPYMRQGRSIAYAYVNGQGDLL